MTITLEKSIWRSLFLGLAVLAAANPARASGALPVTMHTLHQVRPGYYDATATYAQISGTGSVVRLANKALKLAVMQQVHDFRKETELQLHQRPVAAYQLLTKTQISMGTRTLVSASLDTYVDEDGAHGNTFHTVVNVGTVRGEVKVLSLQDLFHPTVNGIAVTKAIVLAKLKQNSQAGFVQDGTVKTMTPQLISRFIITPTGITFLFDPYDVGPYSEGSPTVTVPFAGFGTDLDPNGPLKPFLPNTPMSLKKPRRYNQS